MSENQIALKNLVSMETLTNEEVMALIKRGIEFKNGAKASYEDQHIISNLFFEPSTRTHKAFEVAELKLGCDLLDFDVKTSSVNKGETLYDTILTMSALGVDVCGLGSLTCGKIKYANLETFGSNPLLCRSRRMEKCGI